jgi:uncharacterized phage protein (TIGR01671 family)
MAETALQQNVVITKNAQCLSDFLLSDGFFKSKSVIRRSKKPKIFCGDIIYIKFEYQSQFDDDEICTMESIQKVVSAAGGYNAITTYGWITYMNNVPAVATEIIGNIYDNPELFEANK